MDPEMGEQYCRNMVRRGLSCVISVMILMLSPAAADSLDDGVQAYERGDYQAAIEAWMPLADQGDRDALFNMGQLYRMGKGLARDPVMAEYFYRQAAEKGHLAAQGNLGTLYYFGFDDSPRIAPALQWWHKAARGGDSRSQYMIGILYYNGAYVERDKVRAYAWIRRAALAGLPEAVEAEGKLVRALSVKELAAGNNLAPRVQELPVVLKGGEEAAPASDVGMVSESEGTLEQAAVDNESQAVEPHASSNVEAIAVEEGADEAIAGYYVQLAALSTFESAEAQKDDIQAGMPLLAGDPGLRIEEAALDDGRSIYRLLVGGFLSREEAALRCARIKDAGRDCFVVRR
jgi:TPR repeat protein